MNVATIEITKPASDPTPLPAPAAPPPTAEEELAHLRTQYAEAIAFHARQREEWEDARRIMGQTIEDQTREIDGLGSILDDVVGIAKTAMWEQRLIAPSEIRSVISHS